MREEGRRAEVAGKAEGVGSRPPSAFGPSGQGQTLPMKIKYAETLTTFIKVLSARKT